MQTLVKQVLSFGISFISEKGFFEVLDSSGKVPCLPKVIGQIEVIICHGRIAVQCFFESTGGSVIHTKKTHSNAQISVNLIKWDDLAQLLKFIRCLLIILKVQAIET